MKSPLRETRQAMERLPPLLGAPVTELGRLSTLSMVVGDWRTATEAAAARLSRAPDDEAALVALAVGLWELGDEERARAAVAWNGRPVAPSRLRAAVRFHHYADEPEALQRALDALPDPSTALVLGAGESWLRHAEYDRALAAAERVLRDRPQDARARALRASATAERALLEGTWAPPAEAAPIDPVPGRVLHLLQWSLPERRSGSTYRSRYLFAAQAAAGLEPHVLTQPGFGAAPGSELGRVEIVEGIPHYRLPDRAGAGAPVDARLRDYLEGASRVVEQVRPAVLHPATDYRNALVGLELGRRHGIPVVYEVRGFPETTRGRWGDARQTLEKSVGRRRIEARCWREADRVVTLGAVMKRRIADHGVDPSRIEVVPNAVDPDRFKPVAPDPALRARLGIAPGELVLGYVSTLARYEGIPTLLDATARLVRAGRPVRTLLVGDGFERRHLTQLAQRLGIGEQVIFTGRVPHDDTLAYYALMDVFVVPRRREEVAALVTPLKPYEAMAAGRTVVVSATPALREMVVEGETGLSFATEDAADLVRVIERLAADPALRERLGRQARDWVIANRAWAANGARCREIYAELGAA